MNRLHTARSAVFTERDRLFLHPTPPWTAFELCKTCLATLTILPLRLIGIACIIVVYALLSRVLVGGAARPSGLPLLVHRMVGKACSAVLLLVLGFVWVEVRGKRDVRAAAQLGLPADVPRSLSCLPAQDRARTLIANHIAHLDILVMMALDLPAFVAKAATQDVPLVGYIASALGCIFVKGATSQGQAAEEEQKTPPTSRAQASPSDFTWDWFSAVWRIARAADDALLPKQQREAAPRSAVSEIIARQERLARDAKHLRAGGSGSVDALPQQGWLGAMHASVWPWLAAHGWVGLDDVSPPLLVFAEGTTTNGSDVMQFRRGAFLTSSTVQPIAITYHWRHASESWESVPVGVHAFRLLTQLTHAVTISYLPIVAPEQEPPAVPPFDLVSHDEATTAHDPLSYDPGAFAAVVRQHLRLYLAACRRLEGGRGLSPDRLLPPLRSCALLVPGTHLPCPVPHGLAERVRQYFFGSGFRWFQAHLSHHETQASHKWRLHAAIKAGQLHWQWWRQPYHLPLLTSTAGTSSSTDPPPGGVSGILCALADGILPAECLAWPWLLRSIYLPAQVQAWVFGDAVTFPGHAVAVPGDGLGRARGGPRHARHTRRPDPHHSRSRRRSRAARGIVASS